MLVLFARVGATQPQSYVCDEAKTKFPFPVATTRGVGSHTYRNPGFQQIGANAKLPMSNDPTDAHPVLDRFVSNRCRT